MCFVLAFVQAPGLTVADTKYDLSQNPLGFLERASHLWNVHAPFGQVQNQAYGYFFPHGAFFGLGQVLGIPPWITQRLWWALLLFAGFWGIIRLAETLGVGSRASRIIAAVAFVASPRVLTTIGSISSETAPMMLAPWVLLAPAALVGAAGGATAGKPWSPARSAVAVALMGAVNAVATVAAVLPALLWWLAARPNRAWWRFTAQWIPLLVLATFWWIVPLLLLGRVSPPFLDYIESSGVTTQWASLTEVLRGTDSWTPFVSPERIAGAVLVTQPAAVLATGLIAAAGMAGLAMRSNPVRGRLVLILFVGLAGLTAGYVGELGSPIAESVRVFLDSGGAPLRNVHKLEPLIRIPLVLGLAHLLARVPLPVAVPAAQWRPALAHPERHPMLAVSSLILVALTLASSLAWTAKLAPRGAYDKVPGYWHETADWLAAHAGPDTRALLLPGAPLASQTWGLTRDEPLQALAKSPWVVRDAVPLNPPGAIRAMDSVQRLVADGRPSATLATTLRNQGIGYLVVRNDLDPETSRSTRPLMVHQTVSGSPGLTKVTQFGPDIDAPGAEGFVTDGDLLPSYPAVEIWRVDAGAAPPKFPVDSVPIVQGGPEVLQRLGIDGPAVLAADAARAGIAIPSVVVTDTPTARETDYGQVDSHSSALRAPDDPRRVHNLVPDYPVPGAEPVRGQWSGGRISVSSSASDATQLGGTAPGSGPVATIDGDPATSWISNGLERATGQWLRVDLDRQVRTGMLTVATSPAAAGPAVKWLEIRTERGTSAARVEKPGKPLTIALPGPTKWLQIVATQTENGTRGNQFGISELSLQDFADRQHPVPVPIRHRTVLPPTPPGAAVSAWDLGQELPGRGGCYDAPDRVRCHKGLALAPEEPGTFQRTLQVPASTSVRPQVTVHARQGPALESLLTVGGRPVARGAADIADVRGSAYAATDDDPRTSWTAPEDTVREIGGALPTITVELPAPQLVSGLEIRPSVGQLPAHPLSVSVNLGAGPQVRELPDGGGTIELFPTVTDRIELSIVSWKGVLDKTAIGFQIPAPAGLAEVRVLPQAPGPPLDPQRRITVDCAHGPVVDVAGRRMRTTVTGTAREFATGAPLSAVVCDAADPPGDTGAVPLPAGAQDVSVTPGALFVVDRLRLDTDAPAVPSPTPILVTNQSVNVGWHGPGPPVTVNGWQQGFISNTMGDISFPLDRWYRLSIFGGLLLLVPLLLLAWRRGAAVADPPRPWHSTVVGAAGLLGCSFVIAGLAGVGLTIAGVAAIALYSRYSALPSGLLAGVAGGGTAVAAALLSRGPWRDPEGYVGHSMWVQLPALIAVIAVGVAALPGVSERMSDLRHRRSRSRIYPSDGLG